jgi:hypothetical protein
MVLKALRDVGLARMAIFNEQLTDDKRYTSEAQTAIGNAKSDNTVFTKAEADLKPPGIAQPELGPQAPLQQSGSLSMDR